MDLMTRLKVQPMLCDGAMGTQLMADGLSAGEPAALWNVERVAAVEDVHRAYRDAGCDMVTTNTFGGTRTVLAGHGLADRAAELNEMGVRLCRRAVGGNCFLLGNIGPCGAALNPHGSMAEPEMVEVYREQARSLKRGGADAILIETMGDPDEMRIAIEAATAIAYWPVIATYAFTGADGAFRTLTGATVKEAIETAINAGANVVGANCGAGLRLSDYVELAEAIVATAGKTPVIVQPNAGAPRVEDGRTVYPAAPQDMADIVKPLLAAGVRIVGGCCGTTPAHLRAMAEKMPR